MKQDPINTGSHTLGLLVANTKNMADTQAQSNLMVGNYLKEGYNKLANAYALNLQQAQLDKENAFKQESLNLQKQQMTNQVQQWWDTKQQWAEQNKLEKQKMQESARVANLQFDLANRKLAYQKERDKPSIGLQQHQLDSLTSLSTNPLFQVPTTQDFGVAGRSAGVSAANSGNGGNAEVSLGLVGGSVAGTNKAGFGASSNTKPIAGGVYTKYLQSQMPQKETNSNSGLNITGKDVYTHLLGQDTLAQAAKVGGFYTLYSKSQMPQQETTKEVSLAAQMPKDDLARYFIPAPKPKPQQTNTQEFLIPAYQAVLIKLDNNMPLTAQDQYVANLMGIKYDDGATKKHRIVDLTKSVRGFYNGNNAIETIALALQAGKQSGLGFWNGLSREVYRGTKGITGISKENIDVNSLENSIIQVIADALVEGRTLKMDKEAIMKDYSVGFRTYEEYERALGNAMKKIAVNMEQELRDMKTHGAMKEYNQSLPHYLKAQEIIEKIFNKDDFNSSSSVYVK